MCMKIEQIVHFYEFNMHMNLLNFERFINNAKEIFGRERKKQKQKQKMKRQTNELNVIKNRRDQKNPWMKRQKDDKPNTLFMFGRLN